MFHLFTGSKKENMGAWREERWRPQVRTMWRMEKKAATQVWAGGRGGRGGGWDLCGCKMGLFPPLWDSSCKLAPHTFNWADIYTVAQKQASFSAAASHPSPSASQAQSKVKSIFFFIFPPRPPARPPARPPFLPLGRTVKYIIDFLELRTPDWESAGCKDLDQSPGFNLTPPIKLSGDPLTPHSAQRSIPQAAADILFFFLTNTQSLNKV